MKIFSRKLDISSLMDTLSSIVILHQEFINRILTHKYFNNASCKECVKSQYSEGFFYLSPMVGETQQLDIPLHLTNFTYDTGSIAEIIDIVVMILDEIGDYIDIPDVKWVITYHNGNWRLVKDPEQVYGHICGDEAQQDLINNTVDEYLNETE